MRLMKAQGAIESVRRALRVATFEVQSEDKELYELAIAAERATQEMESKISEVKYNLLKEVEGDLEDMSEMGDSK